MKMKKFLSLVMAFFMIISASTTIAHAEGPQLLTKDAVLGMSKAELLLTLKDNGLLLPDDYAAHPELAENFVYKYTHLIIDGTVDSEAQMFNYAQSNELLHNLGNVLADLGMGRNSVYSTRSTYTLKNNTAIGSWSDSYQYYNCYAYSLGKTRGLQPGTNSGKNFSLTMSISDMADVVLADLAAEGYWGYTTTTKPTSLPDEYFRIIAMRKDTGNEDYHFMRPYNGTLNSWSHKPGGTQPLKWNYTSPGYTTWSNECVYKGVAHAPTVTYESTVYYILYKHKGDPGIQPWSLGVETE